METDRVSSSLAEAAARHNIGAFESAVLLALTRLIEIGEPTAERLKTESYALPDDADGIDIVVNALDSAVKAFDFLADRQGHSIRVEDYRLALAQAKQCRRALRQLHEVKEGVSDAGAEGL